MICQATQENLPAAAALAAQLFQDNPPEELSSELAELIDNADAAVFLCTIEDQPIGFAQCQLRRDYVEGTHTSPVGYLEGIYVAPDFRGQGCAKALLSACEQWAKAQGCTEFASDCELDNGGSLAFHLKAGFTEANRIICFTKSLS